MNNLLNGKIASYVDYKYGFIKGDDGSSYFFHYSDLDEDKSLITVGRSVQFTALATPKGMAAKNIKFAKDYIYKYLPEFRLYRYGEKVDGIIEWSCQHITKDFHTIEEARNSLIDKAHELGVNAVIDARLETSQKTNINNYIHKVHSYTAELAILSNNGHCSTREEADRKTLHFEQITQKAKENAEDQIETQQKKLLLKTIVIALVIFFMIFSNDKHEGIGLSLTMLLWIPALIPFVIASRKQLAHKYLILLNGIVLPAALLYITNIITVPAWLSLITYALICIVGFSLSMQTTEKVIQHLQEAKLLKLVEWLGIKIMNQ
ncbi:cold shock domain-containing protein [Photobacterium leiognathi]|uniref:cold-shock protein n=1 Tax=Photobacterium leiognathi TaxID=553611 RepID=UPI001EDF9869|nr:cold shock domain-containing protein [Photobacterium leiognathi]MCG3884435.1 cold shock domain-containing protein [Photobacterium leiognathi]